MGQQRTFFEAIQARVEAILNGANPAFLRVHITPEVNLSELVRIPRWPVAVINDRGGSLSQTNGKIWTGSFSVTIVTYKPRDHSKESGMLELMDLGDLLISALEYDTDDSIWNSTTSQVESVSVDGSLIVGKTWVFEYQYERA